MRVVGQTTNMYAYAYDPIGNRLSASRNLDDLTYVSNGQTIEPTYDADGNLLTFNGWTFTWNGENRLATATNGMVTLSFSYDYMGRRIAKAIAGGATFAYTYDGWNLLRERKTVGGTSATKDFIWGLDLSQTLQGAGGVGGLLSVILPGETPLETFAVYDANGNVTEYVNASGTTVAHYEYDPFGGISRQTGALADEFPHRFSTKYLDSETGLVYYGYRYYSPDLGRWLSRDPIGETGGVNLYSHIANHAIGQTDYLGLFLVRLQGECERVGDIRNVRATRSRTVPVGARLKAIDAARVIVRRIEQLDGSLRVIPGAPLGGVASPVEPGNIADRAIDSASQYFGSLEADIVIDVEYQECVDKCHGIWRWLTWVDKRREDAYRCHVDKGIGDVSDNDVKACAEDAANRFVR